MDKARPFILFFFVALALSFLTVTFKPELTTVYASMLIMIVIYLLLPVRNQLVKLNVFPKVDILRVVVITLAGYAIFNLLAFTTTPYVSQVFEGVYGTEVVTSADVPQLITQFSSLPAGPFETSKLARQVTESFLIPIIETSALIAALLGMYALFSKLGIPRSIYGIDSLLMMVLVGGVFAVYHITAKGITNTPVLFVSFLFGAVSAGMCIFTRQAAEANWMHVLNNGLISFGFAVVNT